MKLSNRASDFTPMKPRSQNENPKSCFRSSKCAAFSSHWPALLHTLGRASSCTIESAVRTYLLSCKRACQSGRNASKTAFTQALKHSGLCSSDPSLAFNSSFQHTVSLPEFHCHMEHPGLLSAAQKVISMLCGQTERTAASDVGKGPESLLSNGKCSWLSRTVSLWQFLQGKPQTMERQHIG